jgi:hypothetical protein
MSLYSLQHLQVLLERQRAEAEAQRRRDAEADAVAETKRNAAAAAARIVGKPDICEAADRGQVALVKDHLLADPFCVFKRDDGCVFLNFPLDSVPTL